MASVNPLNAGPVVGQTLGGWRLVRRLGAGGMATVYAAQHATRGQAAIKILHPDTVAPDDLSRLEREFSVLASLSHPNVVRVMEFGTWEGWPCLVMELVDGEDLDALVARWQQHPEPDRFALVEQIVRGLCGALQEVHGHGLVHRDLKPGNVLLTREGIPKLTDFGVARFTDSPSLLTRTGRLIGTIAYMAPELIADEAPDARTDLYGLGAILYTLLTLRRPIEADSVAGYLTRHLTEPPTPPHEIDPDIPARLEQICLRLLEKHRDLRYRQASDVVAALDGVQDYEGPALHGRQDLVGQWLDVLARLEAGHGSVVWIDGQPGGGRSALLHHLLRLAEQRQRPTAALDDAAATASIMWCDDAGRASPELRRRINERIRSVLQGAAQVVLLVESAPPRLTDADVVFKLEPLTSRAVAALLRDRAVPAPIATALARRWGGTAAAWPGAIREQVDALTRAGWLQPSEAGLIATRPLSAFQNDELPPTPSVDRLVRARLERLEPEARELVELLALLSRPVPATLLVRATERPVRGPAAVQALLASGLAVAEPGPDDHTLRLSLPGTATVITALLTPERARTRHLALAHALERQRRRGSALEIARHYDAAGHPESAIEQYLQSAEAALTQGRAEEALEATNAGQSSARAAGLSGLSVRRLLSLHGKALLATGRWPTAVAALEDAVAAARQGGSAPEIASTLGDLGSARHRLGRFDEAIPALDEAILLAGATPDVFQRAMRTRADVELQRGRVGEAELLLRRALDNAVERADRNDEARARRGLASVFVMRAQFEASADELELADEMLVSDGDVRVRAGVLARRVELELVAGRLGLALARADVLLDLAQTRGLHRRTAEALALSATVRLILGQDELAGEQAGRALALSRGDAYTMWDAGLRAIRVLIALGRDDQVDEDWLSSPFPHQPVADPAAQALAVLARLRAPKAPTAARRLLGDVLDRPPAGLNLARTLVHLDIAHTALALGDPPTARDALAPISRWLDPRRCDGVLLEISLLRQSMGSRDPEAAARTARIAEALAPRLRETFLTRPGISALLNGGTTPPGAPSSAQPPP